MTKQEAIQAGLETFKLNKVEFIGNFKAIKDEWKRECKKGLDFPLFDWVNASLERVEVAVEEPAQHSAPKILLFKKTQDSDLSIGLKVAYQDMNGEYTKIGEISAYTNEGWIVDGACYTADELKLIDSASKPLTAEDLVLNGKYVPTSKSAGYYGLEGVKLAMKDLSVAYLYYVGTHNSKYNFASSLDKKRKVFLFLPSDVVPYEEPVTGIHDDVIAETSIGKKSEKRVIDTLTPDQVVEWIGETRDWIWSNVSSQPGTNYQLQVDDLSDQELIDLLDEHFPGGCDKFIQRTFFSEPSLNTEPRNPDWDLYPGNEAGAFDHLDQLEEDKRLAESPDYNTNLSSDVSGEKLSSELLASDEELSGLLRNCTAGKWDNHLKDGNVNCSGMLVANCYSSLRSPSTIYANAQLIALSPSLAREVLQLRKEVEEWKGLYQRNRDVTDRAFERIEELKKENAELKSKLALYKNPLGK